MPAAPLSRRDEVVRLAMVAVGVVLLGVYVWGVRTADRGPFEVVWTLPPLVVTPVYLVSGWVAWARRPQSHIGQMVLVVGLLYLGGELFPTDSSIAFTVAWSLQDLYFVVAGHMLLAFPSGRLTNRRDRTLVAGLYLVGALSMLEFSLQDPDECDCLPTNLAQIADLPGLVDVIQPTTAVLSALVSVGFVWVLSRRWREASPVARRSLLPVYVVGVAGGLLEVAWQVAYATDATWIYESWFRVVESVVTAAIPLGFLVGLLRSRMGRAAVSDLVVELGAGAGGDLAIRDALAARLGDDGLEIAHRLDDGTWVDARGEHFDIDAAEADPRRSVALLEAGGEPFAALVHDEALRHEPEVVESALSAARLAISNERLNVELAARLRDVQDSRRRIVEAGDDARRQVERDLHDGAQQRLVSAALALDLLGQDATDPDVRSQLDEVQAELRDALAELRALARGLHPAILGEEGIAAAVEGLAARSPVPVQLDGLTEARFSSQVETTAYFVVAEALTNTTKYATATTVTVTVVQHDGAVVVEVADDGLGGADLDAGSGLRGLQDRVAAVGGTLSVWSPPGEGTRVRAELPTT